MSGLEELENKIDELRKEVKDISKKLDIVMEKLQVSADECARMGNHITFVEGIYDSVKSPLNYICEKVNHYRETNIFMLEDDIERENEEV